MQVRSCRCGDSDRRRLRRLAEINIVFTFDRKRIVPRVDAGWIEANRTCTILGADKLVLTGREEFVRHIGTAFVFDGQFDPFGVAEVVFDIDLGVRLLGGKGPTIDSLTQIVVDLEGADTRRRDRKTDRTIIVHVRPGRLVRRDRNKQ